MKKYVFVIGCQKAGTTLMYQHLSKHPQIDTGNSIEQEMHYFDRCPSPNREEFDGFFNGDDRLKLDVTPAYIYKDGVMTQITETLPVEDLNIIVLLRHPINRAVSQYNMWIRKGKEKLEFNEACWDELVYMKQNPEVQGDRSYIARGLYYQQIKNVISKIPREQVKILTFEDFVSNQQGIISGLTEFLDIDDLKVVSGQKNAGHDSRFKGVARLVSLHGRTIRKRLPKPVAAMLGKLYKMVNSKETSVVTVDMKLFKELSDLYKRDLQMLDELLGTDYMNYYTFDGNGSKAWLLKE